MFLLVGEEKVAYISHPKLIHNSHFEAAQSNL